MLRAARRPLRATMIARARVLAPVLFAGALGLDADGTKSGGVNWDGGWLTYPQMRGLHVRMDGSQDGLVTMSELLEFATAMRFEAASQDVVGIRDGLDEDADGHISESELLRDAERWGDDGEEDRREVNARAAVERAKFVAADDDGDGLLDLTELKYLFFPETHSGVMQVVATAAVAAKDRDGDKKLTMAEFWGVEATQKAGATSLFSEEEKADFDKLDTDSDGFLTAEEVKVLESGSYHTEAALSRLFTQADENKDGALELEELFQTSGQLEGLDGHYHLLDWAERSEL